MLKAPPTPRPSAVSPLLASTLTTTSHDQLSQALESLLQRFATLLRAVGGRHGLSDVESDELMQSIRLRLWRAKATSEQIAATSSSYIYRTAISAAVDIIRARRGREDSIDAVAERDERQLSADHSPERDAESAELETVILAAVDEIVASRRPVVRMYLAGYDREEIASLLGWSEAKTRNLLYRGLADLRAILVARGITPGASA
jgi:RNA polymerase sigma factor (sigma-70 family)